MGCSQSDCFPPRFLLRVDFLIRGWRLPCRGRREGCSEGGASTGTARPGPAEGGRRGGRCRGAGTSLVKAVKACCSEARRPASAGPPLASPQPCSSSPFAPAGARHGKAPPPHTQPAAPNCATEFMGAGRAERRRRGGGGGHVRCGLAPGPLRRSAARPAASPWPPEPARPGSARLPDRPCRPPALPLLFMVAAGPLRLGVADGYFFRPFPVRSRFRVT